MATDTVTIEKLTRTFEAGNTRFVVTAEIRPVQAVAPYLTVDLTPADPNSKALSISADIYERTSAGLWRDSGGGKCVDQIRAAFPNDATIQRLCNLWDKYHLSEMSAGTREQNAIIEAWKTSGYPGSRTPGRYDYADACLILANAGKLDVPIPEDSRKNFEFQRRGGELPTMYRYGSAWLSGALPAEVVGELRELMKTPEGAAKPAPATENRSKWAELGIKMSVSEVDRNPNMPDFEGDHYKCVFSRGRARMTVYFSKGYAHKGAEPTIDEVIQCLASDAAGIENAGSFEAWCGEYGYDTDSRSAEKTYKACEHSATRLKNFLGADLYDQILWHTERQ